MYDFMVPIFFISCVCACFLHSASGVVSCIPQQYSVFLHLKSFCPFVSSASLLVLFGNRPEFCGSACSSPSLCNGGTFDLKISGLYKSKFQGFYVVVFSAMPNTWSGMDQLSCTILTHTHTHTHTCIYIYIYIYIYTCHHPTKQQLYGHLSPIMKTIKVRRTRHAWELGTNS